MDVLDGHEVLERVGQEDGVEVPVGQVDVEHVRHDGMDALALEVGDRRNLVDGPPLLGRDAADELTPSRGRVEHDPGSAHADKEVVGDGSPHRVALALVVVLESGTRRVVW